jgi:hypothetical protein
MTFVFKQNEVIRADVNAIRSEVGPPPAPLTGVHGDARQDAAHARRNGAGARGREYLGVHSNRS